MTIIENPAREEWAELTRRPAQKFKKIEKIVKPILKKVRKKGDAALRYFALEYDHVELKDIQVSAEEFEQAEEQVDQALKEAIQIAYNNISKFHEAQKTDTLEVETMPGVRCFRRSVAIEKVGLYIPGGTAPLFSTVLMTGVPAKIAGCQEIVMCTPSNRRGQINPAILYTARLVGVDKVFKIGGAQAIAAMAYGTESVPKVHKIFGPGNQYVTVAKQLVSKSTVAIDMPAGPSEVAILADDSANPSFVAADLLSQAEHGVDSQVVLISDSKKLVDQTIEAVKNQLPQLPRQEIAREALKNSMCFIVSSLNEGYELLNEYAAEHLIIATAHPEEAVEKVRSAGSVFLGHYTPESVGDYASGTNHTLPTNGFAKSYSGISLDSYVKKITYQSISPKGLHQLGPYVEKMAAAEQLEAHKNAVSLRLQKIKNNGDSAVIAK
ncbi:histidinol dehydrogenase [Tunicatimonas pelagia]|uniref:histidinol dehydrogenase n=1 Tax=Tunicatimonas pelagia TaxID=931531 RepID=UPI0026660569|nr:histidinol dehydrogenase [Tunicatimonas pelagia]WKN43134.1 histidinol dehydrogenase [Tunicatimonas pelagia]